MLNSKKFTSKKFNIKKINSKKFTNKKFNIKKINSRSNQNYSMKNNKSEIKLRCFNAFDNNYNLSQLFI